MNKKLIIGLLVIVLIGWIAGCCYYYNCKIRKNCNTELVDNKNAEDSINSQMQNSAIEKPSFTIKDGDALISRSTSNVSFANGTAEIEIPDSVKTSLSELATYLNENPDKNLKITGLYPSSNSTDSLGMARANTMISYFETNEGIASERMSAVSLSSDELYMEEGTNRTIGGLEYEIVSKNEPTVIEENDGEEETAIEEIQSNKTIDLSVQRKVKGRKIMYYPLTHFQVEETYELERYFKNLKKYFDQNSDGLVQITGHTEAVGDASLNIYHSKKYAKEVKNYLISEYKMNPRNFRIKARGDTRPVTASNTDLGIAENRRIEFTFIK